MKRSNPNRKYPGIIFTPQREVGNQILNVEKLSKSVDGRVLFNNVTFTVNKGDKIAFYSRDPLAVTNFFDIITAEKQADKGKFEWGTTVTHAYLPWKITSIFTGRLQFDGLAASMGSALCNRCG